jgi:sulfatase modifying factor 1
VKNFLITILFFLSLSGHVQAQKPPDMLKVDGGTFNMGDAKGTGEPDERPVHTVTLKSFSLSKTEVTVAQWRVYCKAIQRSMPDAPAWGWKDDHPIVSVSWEEAVAYCKWLSDKTGKKYRLPTEAEWEYAAKGGKKSKKFLFSGSQEINDVGWYRNNSNGTTHPVAQKKPNELGLYDMSGNAWEWCSDFLEEYSPGPVTDPAGAATGTFVLRRGGSWDDALTRSRSTYRIGNSFRRSYHSLGFRLAMSE